jgi:hypothetical protein
MENTNLVTEHEYADEVFTDIETPVDPIIEEDIQPLKKKKSKHKALTIGSKVVVNEDVKFFCDGSGIPDRARVAYVKGIDNNSKTVLIAVEPDGKEFGVLFTNNVSLL